MTRTSLKSYELPKRAEIVTAARRFLGLIYIRGQAPQNEAGYLKWKERVAEAGAAYPKAAAELSRVLLGRVEAELAGKRLLIVADGVLQFVPFAALPKPVTASADASSHSPLIAQHEIVMLPSASTLSVLRRDQRERKPYTKTIAIFADPVFDVDDPRVGRAARGGEGRRAIASTRADAQKTDAASATPSTSDALRSASEVGLANRGQLRRLLDSKREAEAILAAAASEQGTLLLGFDATRERVMTSDLAEYRIVHFATHGLLNSRHSELSGVVLSLIDAQGKPQNGFLRLHEIFNLKLPVDMVVLSACRTGLGKDIRGEGLVGLTRGFMYAGASRVVASLWSVDDAATTELMRIFYRKMLREQLSPAAALRAAQNELRQQEEWQSPYYWAGFVLQGEWQNTRQQGRAASIYGPY